MGNLACPRARHPGASSAWLPSDEIARGVIALHCSHRFPEQEAALRIAPSRGLLRREDESSPCSGVAPYPHGHQADSVASLGQAN